jgi:hypothetical protein
LLTTGDSGALLADDTSSSVEKREPIYVISTRRSEQRSDDS